MTLLHLEAFLHEGYGKADCVSVCLSVTAQRLQYNEN